MVLQVIQPTPVLSPCGSEGTLYDRPVTMPSTSPPAAAASVSGLSVPKLAPLASISSCAVSASSDVECKSVASIGSDSVFLDEDCIDTEDEAEEFSTDSENDNNNNYNGIYGNHSDLCETPSGRARVPFAEHLQICRYPRTLAGRWHNVTGAVCRRYSSPSSQKTAHTNVRHPSANADDEQFPSCSKSCDTFIDSKIYLRPPIPLPQSDDDDSLSDSDTINNDQEQQSQDNNSEQKQSKQQHSQSQQLTQQCDKDETEDDKTIEVMSSLGSSGVLTRKEQEETEKEKEDVVETKDELNLPKIAESEFSELSLVQSQPITSASCDHLVKALTEKSKILSSSMKDIVEHCSSWSQETLF